MLLCFKQKGKHKVPANFSSGNRNQEKIKDGQKHKLSSQITTKKTKRKKKELICDSSEEDSDCDKNKERVPEDVEKEKINENPPHLVFITSMIKKCSGCDTKFTEKERKRPKDMVYKFMMFRSRPKGDGTWIKNTYRSPAYFHSVDLGCLRNLKELRHLEKDDIYMGNEAYFALSKEHIDELKQRKIWDYIKRSRAELVNKSQIN